MIVIEGLDGSGKKTQSKMLFNFLKSIKKNVKLVSMPNYESDSSGPVKMYLNSEITDKPEQINAFATSSFFAVDRFINYVSNWKNFYEKDGSLIVCDRYVTSNMIYQLAKLDYSDWDEFLEWLYEYEYIRLGIPVPDLVIYLKVPVEVSQMLIYERYNEQNSKKDLHEKNLKFLKMCEETANYTSKKFKWETIDCLLDNKIDSFSSIFNKVLNIVTNRIVL
ncbi:MAG: deoxynucleoside kinase [Firmicutes bacterium]|nr:deoxynucleoside kinase [Bacillota bacterium]